MMNFTYFLTPQEVKENGILNANVDSEYIEPALREAQDVFLREIIGDALYNAIENKINGNTLTDKYQTLVEQHIKNYLGYKMLSLIVVGVSMKIRNAGVIQQYDQGFNSSNVKDVAYLADYYNNRVEFYENRMTEYLKKNSADFPEYGYSSENITNPTQTHTAGTIYLGGGRKRSCGANYGGSGGGSTDSVEWNDIQNKPNFATVATSGSYNDLQNKPNIPTVNNATLTIKQGGTTKGTFTANAGTDVEIDLDAGGSGSTDWSDIQNKPDFATVAESGNYNDLSNRPDMDEYVDVETYNQDMGQVNNTLENKVSYGVYTPKMEAIDNALTDKVDTVALCTINNERLDTRSNFELVRTDSITQLTIKQGGTIKGTFTPNSGPYNVEISLDAGGSGSTDWNDITNKPYYFGFLSLNMSRNGVKLAGQTQFDELTTDISSGVQLPFKVDAAQSTKLYTDYIITGENTGGASELIIEGDDGNNVYGKITKDGIYEGTDKLSDKYLQITNLPTNVSAFTNDAGYLTQHQSLAGYATENWVQQQGYSTFSGSYNDLSDKPTIPAAQVNSDWNASTGVAQILNKPTIPTKTSELTNDSGFTTFDGDYNSLTNKPTIPAAQVQSDWNQSDTTAVDYIKNKPNVKPDLDLSTLTQAQYVDFYSNYTTYRTNYDLNWGGLPILSINSWQPPVEMSPVPVMVVQYGIYGQSALMTGGDDEVFFGVQLVAADGSVMPYSDSMTFKQICHTASYNDLVNKPALATVATSGSYNDLSDKPTIPTKTSELTNDSGYSTFSGSYNDLSDKPNYSSEVWTFELSGGTTVTKKVVIDLS